VLACLPDAAVTALSVLRHCHRHTPLFPPATPRSSAHPFDECSSLCSWTAAARSKKSLSRFEGLPYVPNRCGIEPMEAYNIIQSLRVPCLRGLRAQREWQSSELRVGRMKRSCRVVGTINLVNPSTGATIGCVNGYGTYSPACINPMAFQYTEPANYAGTPLSVRQYVHNYFHCLARTLTSPMCLGCTDYDVLLPWFRFGPDSSFKFWKVRHRSLLRSRPYRD
jgi:hypothetical protein